MRREAQVILDRIQKYYGPVYVQGGGWDDQWHELKPEIDAYAKAYHEEQKAKMAKAIEITHKIIDSAYEISIGLNKQPSPHDQIELVRKKLVALTDALGIIEPPKN